MKQLAGDRGSGGKKHIVRNHQCRTASGEDLAATVCARHGEAVFTWNRDTSCNNSHNGRKRTVFITYILYPSQERVKRDDY